jgi:hypothetical protein
LEESGAAIPRTHNLEDLWALLTPTHHEVRPLRRGFIFLTNFAVETRYPGESATKRQAEAALRWAIKTRQIARTLLGLKTR